MKFLDLLVEAINRSEIPLRFEPGADESVARPVAEFVRAWIMAHMPEPADTEFALGQQTLVAQLVAEIEGSRQVP